MEGATPHRGGELVRTCGRTSYSPPVPHQRPKKGDYKLYLTVRRGAMPQRNLYYQDDASQNRVKLTGSSVGVREEIPIFEDLFKGLDRITLRFAKALFESNRASC